MRLRLLTILSAAAFVLGGCGTTAHLTGSSDGSGGLSAPGGEALGLTGSGNGSTGSAGGAGGSGSTSGGSGLGGVNGGLGGGGGSSEAQAGVGGGSGAALPGTAGTRAPGVTATSIFVGISYATESSSTTANQALGAGGVTQGNTRGENQAVINYINSHGGILGRKIVPVWYQENALSTESSTQLYQGECQAFEQDNHVFAILDGGNAITEQCAQSAGAVAVYDNLSISSTPTFAKYPSYFEVGGMMSQNRSVLNEAEALAAQNYFSPWNANLSQPGTSKAKVGILSYDSPDFHYAVDNTLVPALKRLGNGPASQDVVYVTFPQSNADLGTVSADVSNAVLRFRTDGVDHVLIIDGTGILTLEFLNNANSQHYFPRYGFNSQNGPEVLASAGDVPTAQMNGSLGIGWIPMLDLSSSADPDSGPYSNDARRSCLAIMRANGFTYPDTNSESAAIGICTSFQFLKDAITAGGVTIDQANFVAGADRLGYWNGSGDTFGDFFGASQHDGAAHYRYYEWNNSCGCMQYTSGNQVAVGEGET